ncbi:hypothetical protein CCMSSC00406_0009184 [Pleurotus cornucopiae]|uniref:Uncharacterized protein n=1 Tax=Pleurotus cornucopiae TaxID=5321 RepID=A0ACB7IYJ9_PLECO|nr:hypothetical protein CCMSSC00406_0009184 [Pleurotus cornucopiae]
MVSTNPSNPPSAPQSQVSELISGPIASAWEPLTSQPLAPGTTNDRRHSHAAASRTRATAAAFSTPASSLRVSVPRAGPSHRMYPSSQAGTIREFQQGQRTTTTTTASTSRLPETHKFLILLLPYGPKGVTALDDSNIRLPELRLTSPSTNSHVFIDTLSHFHLALEITITAKSNEPVWQVIHRELVQHAINRHLTFPGFILSPDTNRYVESPFALLQLGYQNQQGQKINECKLPGYDITLSKLIKTSKQKHPDRDLRVIFYAGRSLMRGPALPGAEDPHPCFVLRIIHRLREKGALPPVDKDDDDFIAAACVRGCPGYRATSVSSTSSVQEYRQPIASSSSFNSRQTGTSSSSSWSLFDPASDDDADVDADNEFSADGFLSMDAISDTSMPPTPISAVPEALPMSSVHRGEAFHTLFDAAAGSSSQLAPALDEPSTLRRSTRHRLLANVINVDSSDSDSAAHVRPTIDTRSAAILHSTPLAWQASILRTMRSSHPEAVTAIHINAPTEKDAAQALINCLVAHHSGIPISTLVFSEGVEVAVFSFDALPHGICHFQVGSGVGNGVEHAVLRSAIKMIVDDPCYWQNHDGFALWALRPNPEHTTLARQARAKAHGTLYFSTLIDTTFIKKIHSEIADTLLAWPMDPSTPIDITNREEYNRLRPVVMSYLNASSLAFLSDASEEERQNWTLIIYAKCLLAGPNEHIKALPEISAFAEGFNLRISPYMRLNDTFGNAQTTKSLLVLMDARQLHSPTQLIDKLHVIDNPQDEAIGAVFHSHFARYLRGVGHPMPEDPLTDFVSDAGRRAEAENPIYRAQQFLQVSTGSDIVPTDANWAIEMRFVCAIPRRATPPRGGASSSEDSGNSDGVPSNHAMFSFHACSSDVHIFDTPQLRNLLSHPLPDDDTTTTKFDLAVHSHLVSFNNEAHGFNQI